MLSPLLNRLKSAPLRIAVSLAILCLTPSLGQSAETGSGKPLTVFAAASMTDAMNEIGKAYEAEGHGKVVFSFAGTGTLARQLEARAPADVFISADRKWMDYVVKRDAVDPDTVVTMAANSLVLVGPGDAADVSLSADDLAKALGGARLAIAEPETVPAGRYAKQALENLGLWDGLKGNLAPMENVRVALAAVARGETPLGIVYGSDAVIEPRVKVLATFPEDSHTPIAYPVALTPEASPEAKDFLKFLQGKEASKVLEEKGFLPLNKVK